MCSLFKMSLLIFLFASAGQAFYQVVTATVAGTVTEQVGAVILGTKVAVTDTDTNSRVRTIITDGRGEFVISVLPIWHYGIRMMRRSTSLRTLALASSTATAASTSAMMYWPPIIPLTNAKAWPGLNCVTQLRLYPRKPGDSENTTPVDPVGTIVSTRRSALAQVGILCNTGSI
jgi:hypothetical protein